LTSAIDATPNLGEIATGGLGIDAMVKAAVGNPHLVTNPGLLGALVNGNATPQQNSAINAYMSAMSLEQQVQGARATGQPLQLSSQATQLLDGLNVKYDDVNQTPKQAAVAYQMKLAGAHLQVATTPDGRTVMGADGTPQLVAATTKAKSGGGGFWHEVGSLFHDVGKGWNVVSATLGDIWSGTQQVRQDLGIIKQNDPIYQQAQYAGQIDTANLGSDVASIIGRSPAQDAAMAGAGYDPSSWFEHIAYQANGKEYQNTTDLAQAWEASHPNAGANGGDAHIALAQQYLDSAEKTVGNIERDNSLTIAQRAAKLQELNSKDFQDLVKNVASRKADIGGAMMTTARVDPTSSLYKYGSAAIDLAAGLALDPVLVTGRIAGAAKFAQVGLHQLGDLPDTSRISDILLGDTSGYRQVTQKARADVQYGMKRFLGNTNTIRAIAEMGDSASIAEKAKMAGAYADIRATTAALEPLVGPFTGADRILVDENGVVQRVTSGPRTGEMLMGRGAPITTMDEAADYLGSKLGMAHLASGRASVEWSLMPGALSAFGARRLIKAPLATSTARKVTVTLGRYQDAMKLLPWANDAVDDSNKVVAATGDLTHAQAALDHALATGTDLAPAQAAHAEAVTGLASARRAATAEVQSSPRLTGEVQANMMRRGTIDGEGFNLAGMRAARAESLSRRLSTFLPRNMNIALHDASSADKIYKFYQFFANRGDAALGTAMWHAADEGQRRTMIVGIQQQVMHAAGYGASEPGRKALAEVSNLADRSASEVANTEATQMYAVNGQDVWNDPALGGAPVHHGVNLSDVRDNWTLQSFARMARDGANYSLLSRIWGRSFTSQLADHLTHFFKTIQLMKPSTWTRNETEGLGNAALRGMLGPALRAKAAAVEAGIFPERGTTQAMHWIDEHASAKFPNLSPVVAKAKIIQAPLHLVGQAYRHAALRFAKPEDGIDYIPKLSADKLTGYMRDYSEQHLRADLDPSGALERKRILKDGFAPAELTFDYQHDLSPFTKGRPDVELKGFAPESANSIRGAQIYAARLAHLANEHPAYAHLLMDAVKADDGDVSKIVAAMKEDPQVAAKVSALRGSSLMQDDRLGTTREVVTPADREVAREQLARRQVATAKELLVSRQGGYIDTVDAYLRKYDRAPSSSWLMDNVKDDSRPYEVLAPKWVATPKAEKNADGLARAIASASDRAYKRIVEDPIQHTTSLPVFLANYGKARYFLANEEKLTADAIASPLHDALDAKIAKMQPATVEKNAEAHAAERDAINEKAATAADFLMEERAVKMAWVRTEQIIDDPGLKTQFDIVGRNFFMYSRAVQAMIRRWGQLIIQDPTRLEKAALALNAAEHSGMIYHDKYGQLNFIYPGTGPLIHTIEKIAQVLPGFGDFGQLPVTPDLTGKVLFAAPGLENPAKMPASPIINLPVRIAEQWFPGTRQVLDSLDRSWNGPVGAGQIGENFMPSAFRNLWKAMTPDERNSQLTSAGIGSIANLGAADNGSGRYLPLASATGSEKQRFLDRVSTGTFNILMMRWALGLFTPAPASQPTMSTPASRADPIFDARGIHGLADEFKVMVADMGGDYAQAAQLFTAMHPEKAVWYTTPQSKSLAKGATLPATAATLTWIYNNRPFMEKYKAVSAYFVPESKGSFNDRAYQEELALHLRQKDTPGEFYDQVRINQAGQIYWPEYDAYQLARKNAKGNTALENAIQTSWSAESNKIKTAYPAFADNLDAGYGTRHADARGTLAELTAIAADPHAPSSVDSGGLANMINAYHSYEQWRTEHPSSGKSTKVQRDAVTTSYQAYMENYAAGDPALMKVYTNVFRTLSPELLDLSANATGVA